MDTPAPPKPLKFNRWLPYWAVFQYDLHQTLRSWVYLVWLAISVLATSGYMLYKLGVAREAGIIQPASILVSDLLHWSVLGSITLIIVLTGGTISSERGTMADSVLSRGISRYQYFLGKWHARVVAVLGTFLMLGLFTLAGSYFLLHEDLNIKGCLVALATILSILLMVTTCGVTVSAIANSTMVGIAMLWMVLHSLGFVLSMLPAAYPSPDRVLSNLPFVLRGYYDSGALIRLIVWSLTGSGFVALVGLGYFSRKDV